SAIVSLTDPVSVIASYDAMIQPLIDLVGLIPQGNDDRQLTSSVTAALHLVKATDLLSVQQAQINTYLASKLDFTNDEFRAVLSTDAERSTELDQFDRAASLPQKALYEQSINPDNLDVFNTLKITDRVLDSKVDQPLPTTGQLDPIEQ